MKRVFLILFALVCVFGPAAAQGPAAIHIMPSVAQLRASIPAGVAPQFGTVRVLSYYGTGNNCPIDYTWNSSDSNADDGGAVINPTGNGGNGRWDLNIPPKSPVHSCVYGIKIDSSPTGGGGTNNSTQFANLMAFAASSRGPNWIHLDSVQGSCIGFASSMTLTEGLVIEGDGSGQYAGGKTGSCISYTSTTGYIFAFQAPDGTAPFEGPKFRDFTMNYVNSTASTGTGCLVLNSVAGGFTNDASTQQPILHVETANVICNLGAVASNNQIGFFCAKCFDSHFMQTDVVNGATGYDIEGSDNIEIGGGCRVTNTNSYMVKFLAHLTFGNNDSIHNCELLQFYDPGDSHNVDSAIYDGARSSTIRDTFIEGVAPSGGTLGSQVHLFDGFQAGIHDNQVTATATYWLLVDGNYNNINATNNGTNGAEIAPAHFNNGAYWYSSAVQQTLTHSGNGANGDLGWPFNSNNGIDQTLPTPVIQTWTSSTPGLQYSGLGTTEVPTGGFFNFTTAGSTHYLDFRRYGGVVLTGTFNAQLIAWADTGTPTLTCQVTDNDSLVGSSSDVTLTTSPAQYTISFAQAVSTDGGIRCWAKSVTVDHMSQVSLTY